MHRSSTAARTPLRSPRPRRRCRGCRTVRRRSLVEVVHVLAAAGVHPHRTASPTARFMRSKKWQHFSTSVPPVLRLNRFQFAHLHAGTGSGARGSRACGAGRPPPRPRRGTAPPAACSGTPGPPTRCRHGRGRGVDDRLQSSTVVHSGFSTSTCSPCPTRRAAPRRGCGSARRSPPRRPDRCEQVRCPRTWRVPAGGAQRAQTPLRELRAWGRSSPSPRPPGSSARFRRCSQPIMPVPITP
jgi:hypothetical protein